MKKWRLIPLKTHNAFMNMAIDEAILQAKIKGIVPNTIRLYQWAPSAVSVGRFQKVENEVYVENCQAYGVDIVRRISGGGTVYHDGEREITYGVIADKETLESSDIAVIYRKICRGLIEAARILGVDAEFSPGSARQCPNIVVNGRKISGSAQAHKGNVVLQHGTLLLDVDLDWMFKFLRVPWARSHMDILCVAERKITSLKHELGREVSKEEAQKALVKGFENALDIQLVEDELTDFEIKTAERLCKEKYSTQKWNFEGKI